MKQRGKWQCLRTPKRPGRPTFGVIEWSHECTPTLLVGPTVDAVQREAVRLFADLIYEDLPLVANDEAFHRRHPVPDPDDPGADITGWLHLLEGATDEPSFTILHYEVVIIS
jgi:hypothetical protein